MHGTLPLDKDPVPQVSVAVGITIGLLASFVQSLGLTIQRKSHVLDQARPESERQADYRRPLWLLGFVIFITSNILGSIFQIASLPVVILAPLGAVSLLWNAFFARIILGDVFSKYMIIGTFLIGGGAVLIAIFGVVPEPTHSLEDLLILFGRKTFVVYFSLLGAALGIALIITHIMEWSTYRAIIRVPLETIPTPLITTSPPLSPSRLATERTPLLDPKISRSSTPVLPAENRVFTFIAISYASASGLLSGMCLLFAKSGVELLVLTVAGKNQFGRWESWVLVFGLLVFALLQLWYLHKSLKIADPTLVCPLAFCAYNLSSIVNGLVYFNQFGALSAKQLSLVSLGIVILLGGVWAVSLQPGEEDSGVAEGDWVAPCEEDEVLPIRNPEVERLSPVHFNDEESEILLGTSVRWGEPVIPEAEPLPRAASSSNIPSATMSPPGHTRSTSERRRSSQRLETVPELLHYRSPSAPSSPRRTRSRKVSLGHEVGGGEMGVPNLPLNGFSIGLSPMSPGFAVVPRRRTGGIGGGDEATRRDGDDAATPSEPPPSKWPRLRRILSVGRRPQS
jgi:hypothetical protein